MNILGFIGWADHDPAACIIKTKSDGTFDYATIAEERLNRKKYSHYFPLRSIKYCMDQLGIQKIEEIDLVINDWTQSPEKYNSNKSYRKLEFDYIRKNLKIEKSKIEICPTHHLAHAYSVFMPSEFEDAAILVIDALGSGLQGTSLFVGEGTNIRLVESSKCFSLGKLYDAVTRNVLNFGEGEDGKTMGLAAFGEKHRNEPKILNIQGSYEGLDIDYSHFMRRIPDNRIVNDKLRKCSSREELYDPYFAQIAFEVQDEIEKAVLMFVEYAKKKTGCKNLCISGGVALNCVANEKVIQSGIFERVYVLPASSDAGVPLGLALYGYYLKNPKSSYKPELKTAGLGKKYSEQLVTDLLNKVGISYTSTDFGTVSEHISNKNVVGWFDGGSEFGPRALGQRSILADVRFPDMKEIMNVKVKHREAYRPFAPSVLEEHASDYFEISEDLSSFMLRAPKIHADKLSMIPAVSHVDGTGRVQSVSKENNKNYHELIREYFDLTGIPMVLNTSFNDDNEPIVETPVDALLCFLRTKIDFLVFNGKLLVDKNKVGSIDDKIADLSLFRENTLNQEYKSLIAEFLKTYSIHEMKSYLNINNVLAQFYRNHKAYENLFEFLANNQFVYFVGDAFHYNLCAKIALECCPASGLEKLLIVEDYLCHKHQVIQEVRGASSDRPIIIGLYNMSEALKDEVDRDVYYIYEDFQVHLENSIDIHTEEGKVDLSKLEEYSCEYNLSKKYETLFNT